MDGAGEKINDTASQMKNMERYLLTSKGTRKVPEGAEIIDKLGLINL